MSELTDQIDALQVQQQEVLATLLAARTAYLTLVSDFLSYYLVFEELKAQLPLDQRVSYSMWPPSYSQLEVGAAEIEKLAGALYVTCIMA